MQLTKRLPSPVSPGSRLFATRRSGLVVDRWREKERRGQYGSEAALSQKAPYFGRGLGPAETGDGGALKRTIRPLLLVMLMASAMFAQRTSSRATTGTTTTTNGSCTSTGSTSTGTSVSSARQPTQSLGTPVVFGTGSKAAAVLEAIRVVRASRSPSASSATTSGVLLPKTVVPFR